MTDLTDFMQSPLVTWMKTFSDEENKVLDYNHLYDGVFLHDVMLQIDPRPPHGGVGRGTDDATVRIRNMDVFVRNVRSFYEDSLGQLVVIKLPDLVNLNRDPESETSFKDVQSMLLLVLGCAVQCDKKEQFVEKIKELDLTVQHAIVERIQQVTDNPETVWMQEWNELNQLTDGQQELMYHLLVLHLRRIVKERDELWHTMNSLVLAGDGIEKATTPRSSNSDKHHLGVELADCKGKLRRARQELEEKNELLAEIKDELEQNKTTASKLKQESLDLLQDARAAKAYRDELDILRERANKVDKLENEIQRYKDKLNELEFYKSRVEEFREDNRILVETKEMLEEQLESSRKRTEQILELENELLKYKARVNELTLERDAERDRMQELIEDNAQLQLSARHTMNESANLMAELDSLRSHSSSGLGDSMSEQLNKDAQTRLRKLELENQRLINITDNLREASFHESTERILELEKENKRLSLKVTQLQDLGSREMQRFLEAEHCHQHVVQECTKTHEMLETVKRNSDRQQSELLLEKEQLVEMVDNLRQRNQKSNDARFKDIEADNKRLFESTQDFKAQLSRLQFEKQQLERVVERLKDSSEKLTEMESLKMELEKENTDLHRAIATFKDTCDKYEKLEQDHSDLHMKYRRIKKILENMKTTCGKVDKLEQDSVNLTIENHKLNKALETLKSSLLKYVDLEQEKEELVQSNQLLRRNIEALKIDRTKHEQMELDMISLTTETQKLQKAVESSAKKLEDIEAENQDLENENQKLQKTIETLKVSNRRLNDLERENTDLEAENHKLDREKKSIDKEVVRLKQAIEVKDSTIDESSSKISTLERENKRLTKDIENTTVLSSRVRELEKENREIIQQAMIDKKTLIALREDLVNDKIKTQQLSNELEKLNSDLQKIGLKKEKLIVAEHVQDEDRYKALENMMEEALKKSLELKEEKIRGLENRLENSMLCNAELKEELVSLRQKYEALQQRQAEGICCNTALSEKNGEDDVKAKLTKDLGQLRDQVADAERSNAILQEENRNLRQALINAREQITTIQQQLLGCQHQLSSHNEQNSNLQSLNAKLEVENTTLQTHNTSLSTQNSSLIVQNASLEADRDQLLRHQEELQAAHKSLVTDHEALQKLHEQLSSEYENLINDLGSQKTSQKSLKSEYKNLKEKYKAVMMVQEEVAHLQDVVQKERELLKADSKSLNNLRAEHSRLKEDFRLLHTNNEKLKMEFKSLQAEYKTLKTENNTLKLKNTEQQGDLAECNDHRNSLDVEVSKLHSKCEMLSHINATLEQDRKSLMLQVTTLLTQYHELLTQTLDDKDHFHEEEKSFADKLNNLKRQKEKLEEKIMEQYRRMENYSPKKRGFGANLVRKVRRAGTELMSRVPRTTRSKDDDKDRSRRMRDSTDGNDGLDNESLGSVSNESPDSGSEHTLRKHNTNGSNLQRTDSFGDLMDRASQSRMQRNLAYSTTALFPSRKSAFDDNDKAFRGSFSSEDIGSLRAESHSSDGHQGDVESVTSSIVSTQSTSKPQADAEMPKNYRARLSLGIPGTRKSVYYTDEHDTIPTRDVGPDMDGPNHKQAELKLNNTAASSGDTKTPGTPRLVRKEDSTEGKNLGSSTFYTTQYSQYVSSISIVNSPGSPILPTQSTKRSSSLNCSKRDSFSDDPQPVGLPNTPNFSNNRRSLDGVATESLNKSSSTDQVSNNQSSPLRRPSSAIAGSEAPAISPAVENGAPISNCQSWISQQDSSLLSTDPSARNNNSSPTRRPNVLPVNTSQLNHAPNQQLPEKANLNNVSATTTTPNAETTGLPHDKPADNSIWYEYGCV